MFLPLHLDDGTRILMSLSGGKRIQSSSCIYGYQLLNVNGDKMVLW